MDAPCILLGLALCAADPLYNGYARREMSERDPGDARPGGDSLHEEGASGCSAEGQPETDDPMDDHPRRELSNRTPVDARFLHASLAKKTKTVSSAPTTDKAMRKQQCITAEQHQADVVRDEQRFSLGNAVHTHSVASGRHAPRMMAPGSAAALLALAAVGARTPETTPAEALGGDSLEDQGAPGCSAEGQPETDDPMDDHPRRELSPVDARFLHASLQEKGHVYRCASRVLVVHPSLTALIGLCHDKYGLVPAGVLRVAQERGSAAHRDIEDYLNGRSDWPGPDTPVAAAWSLLKPALRAGARLYATEVTFTYQEVGGGFSLHGTADLVLYNDDGTIDIWDWKCSKGIVSDMRCQTELLAPLAGRTYADLHTLQLSGLALMAERSGFRVRHLVGGSLQAIHQRTGSWRVYSSTFSSEEKKLSV